MAKDDDKARSALNFARAKQEKIVDNQPNFGPSWCALGLIDAALGRKEEALREGRRAVELVPLDKDAIRGGAMAKSLAMIAAWVGEIDLACNQLQAVANRPGVVSYGELKLLPFWDSLRGDLRFEKLVEDVKEPVRLEPVQAIAPVKSIAVLPFENRSEDTSNAYFADGVQDEILTRLSRIRDLKVISRTSSQRYRNSPLSLAEVAKQLGVSNVLEGSVQKTNDHVRVNVQLIQAADDSHLWAETYDRKLTDIFAVESEIAAAIAGTLQAKLTGFEQRAIATRPTQNTEAHHLYLKGTFFSNKRTGSDLRTAIEYFKGAIGKDPNYALAYAGLADAYALFALYGGEAPTETVSHAKAAARKALELDETLPEAHSSLGLLLALYDFDFAQSKKEFERAIELNPNHATAHHQFGNVNLSMVGEFDRAIAEGNRAVELDPLSLIINADLGQNLMLARRYDEAIDQLQKTLALDPRFYYARWTLGEALQMKGQLREAIAEYEEAAKISEDPHVMALLAQGYAKSGKVSKARDLLSQLEQVNASRHVGPFSFALAHLAIDDNEKAIDDLEQAFRERDPNIVGIKVEPLLDPLRGHPRFERLLAEIVGNVEHKSPSN
jgi:TolB-like protein/Flp pilus assembly protein TadD